MTESDEASIVTHRALTRGSLLARNVVINAAGSALPSVIGVVALPILVRALGDVRFSVLLLAWSTLGYFSLFDLGIGRAVTHAVAGRLGSAEEGEIGEAIWTALGILVPLSLIVAIALVVGSPWLTRLLGVPNAFHDEAVLAFRVLAIAIPFAVIAGTLRGALEAKQYFGVVNLLRIPYGVFTFAGPVAMLPFSRSLVAAMSVLVVGRVVTCVGHVMAVQRLVPEFNAVGRRWNLALARRLMAYGGWMQVTNIVSPLMNTLDRFVVGAMLGIRLVTYYAAPQELVTKLWLFTMAVLPVFFSAIATTAQRDVERTLMLFDRLLRLTLATVFLPALLIVCFAPEILRFWLGPAFEVQSTALTQLLVIAVFINCVGQAAYTFIQGIGRPDVTGKYHLAELPVYALLLWALLGPFGIMGAAIAWAIRMIGDTILLLATCPVLRPETRSIVGRASAWLIGATAVLVISALAPDLPLRMIIAVIGVVVWPVIVWRNLLTADERRLPLRSFISAWRPTQA